MLKKFLNFDFIYFAGVLLLLAVGLLLYIVYLQILVIFGDNLPLQE